MTTPEPIDLVRLDEQGPVAPYEQVRQQLAAAVAAGRLTAGTRLPTVRALAESLGLANNTVARAYRLLEADGVVQTRGRRGTLVADGAHRSRDDVVTARAAQAYAASARAGGLTLEQSLRLVEEAWAGGGDGAG